jgi:hypothetical protein
MASKSGNAPPAAPLPGGGPAASAPLLRNEGKLILVYCARGAADP